MLKSDKEREQKEEEEKVEIEIEVDEAQTNKDDEDAHSDSMEFRVTDYKETNKLIEEKNVSEKKNFHRRNKKSYKVIISPKQNTRMNTL